MNESSRSAVLQNVRALMELLRKYAPFNQMEELDLAFLIEHCSLAFYAKDDVVIAPEDGEVDRFFILKQGMIRGERHNSQQDKLETTFEIYPGECFPVAALLGERATRSVHRAVEDSFCLELPKRHFVTLFARSGVFRDFCVRGVSSLLDLVNQQIQVSSMRTLGAHYSLDTTLSELAQREPVCCAPDTPVCDAVKRMDERGIGSILITDGQQHPLGIFTLRDLRRLVAQAGTDLQVPIAVVMTQHPKTLPPSAKAFDAALLMARYHIAHIALVEDERLVGVVSERDLFSLQRVDLVHLARTIANAPSIATLAALRTDIGGLIDNMLAHGAAAAQLNRIITLLNDYSVTRAIELVLEEEGDPGIGFTWLAFGSEGRREQTLLTDQDNGILFEADTDKEAEDIRRTLLPLARRINLALDACGFSLCKGNIMAGNPDLCRSQSEWTEWYRSFVRTSTPQNLLNSSIYFDARPVWGEEAAAQGMLQQVVQEVARNSLFQRHLATSALNRRPPLNLFRNFVYSKEVDRHRIDLKVQGLTPFVDASRVLALAAGLSESNTLMRLKLLAEQGSLNALDVNAWEEAYGVIQLMRLRQHQAQWRAGQPLSNLLDPDSLNDLDRRILKEAFRQEQRLQQKLELQYQL